MDLDAKAKQVINDFKNLEKPNDEYSENMKLFYEYIKIGTSEDNEADIAFSIYYDEYQKEIVEALIFSDAEPEDVEPAFDLNERMLSIYEELFFNKTAFRTKLDKLSYLNNYGSINPMGKEIKMRALNLGPEFIYFTYANIVPKTTQQRKLVQRMFMASAYKAMSINYNGINSKVTNAAVQHAKLMIEAFKALEKFSGEDMGEETNIVKVLAKEDKLKGFEMEEELNAGDII